MECRELYKSATYCSTYVALVKDFFKNMHYGCHAERRHSDKVAMAMVVKGNTRRDKLSSAMRIHKDT